MDWTTTEWVVGGLVFAGAGLFLVGVIGLLRWPLRWLLMQPRVRKWLGLMSALLVMVSLLSGRT